ncbi:hypothetical protein OIDMADRAFT_48545 [Oidiodendron maius Zn]|uniref:Uncharacterized protein n=1 Tax=Oidiodendron maius (strain Zn) TaxID=913774 RepID=A0A0C3I2R6_OIDMZ|nr:hypothetical protein OIDMADRAFT_48545 [Oidiodendron maius Zn]
MATTARKRRLQAKSSLPRPPQRRDKAALEAARMDVEPGDAPPRRGKKLGLAPQDLHTERRMACRGPRFAQEARLSKGPAPHMLPAGLPACPSAERARGRPVLTPQRAAPETSIIPLAVDEHAGGPPFSTTDGPSRRGHRDIAFALWESMGTLGGKQESTESNRLGELMSL